MFPEVCEIAFISYCTTPSKRIVRLRRRRRPTNFLKSNRGAVRFSAVSPRLAPHRFAPLHTVSLHPTSPEASLYFICLALPLLCLQLLSSCPLQPLPLSTFPPRLASQCLFPSLIALLLYSLPSIFPHVFFAPSYPLLMSPPLSFTSQPCFSPLLILVLAPPFAFPNLLFAPHSAFSPNSPVFLPFFPHPFFLAFSLHLARRRPYLASYSSRPIFLPALSFVDFARGINVPFYHRKYIPPCNHLDIGALRLPTLARNQTGNWLIPS